MAKADNMLAILMLLQARRRLTARQLAEELEIHIRTVYRCIDALCISGVPIVSETGRDGGYYIPAELKLEPLFFEEAEQVALLHAAQFARASGYPYEEALDKAIAKIKRYASAEQTGWLQAQEHNIEVIHPPLRAEQPERLLLIEQALEALTSLELTYLSGYGDTETQRVIDPYGMVNWKSKWYVVGYCHLRDAIRSFRLDRIIGVSATQGRFERPAAFSAREFLLGSLLPSQVSDDARLGMVNVQIQGTKQALDDLCAHWLFGHTLQERVGDRAYFRLDEHHLYSQVPYYLLSFGGTIRIIEPSELRDYVAEAAESLFRYHRQ
jgi:predicted DNA-binding transcriptional regulator YafY